MNNLPSVCIMIPTYNQAAYVLRAVETALAQDYPELEILVADDNSSDETEAILQPWIQNSRVRFTKNKTNLGRVGNYRQSLYEGTTADWVLNLDGDDYFTNPRFISQAIAAIQTGGDEDVLFYQGAHIYKQEGGKEELHQPRIRKETAIVHADNYFFGYFVRQHFSHMSTLYNRQLAIQSGFYEKELISADIFSLLQFCLTYGNKKVIISKNISGVWLQHDENSSKTVHLKQHWDNFGIYQQLYSLAVKKGYNRIRCFKWLLKASYMYLRLYIGSLLRKLKN